MSHRTRRILAALGIVGALAVVAPPSAATEQPPPPVEQGECLTTVEQAKYQRPTETTEHEVDKYVRERTRTKAPAWQRYSLTIPWLSNEHAPPGPDVWPWAWQANTASDPHGVGVEGAYYRSNGSSGRGDWFWLDRTGWTYGEWSEWGTPTRWLPIGSHLAWVATVPPANWQEHGNSYTSTYERDWSVYPTGVTRGIPGPNEVTGWLSSPPEGEGWTVKATRTIDGESFPCPTATATPGTCEAPGVITTSDGAGLYSWATDDTDPSAVVVTATPIAPAVFRGEVRTSWTFDIAKLSALECTEVPEPTTRTDVDRDVDCDSDVVTITTTSYRTDPVWDPETETYVPGDEVQVGEPVVTTEDATDEECPPPTTTTTVTPTTTSHPTPTTAAPTPTTTAAPVAASSTSDTLPRTGSSTGVLAALAALLIAVGGGAVAATTASRRRG